MSANSSFLHNISDFENLIDATAKELNILPQLVEKDYWIMHCLWGLTNLGLTFELKGGTSLSKGYRIISRFSEDIDVRIAPPVGMQVYHGRNHTKPKHVESRREFYDWLADETAGIPDIEESVRDKGFDNPKLFSAGIRLHYPSFFSQLDGIKQGILLEVGFDDTAPNEPRTISSWAYNKAAEADIDFIDNRAVGIRCYSPAYTFVEKLQTVSTKFRKQQESEKFSQNFLRHYYDIYCLLENGEVQEFIGTDEYAERKDKRFPGDDNQCIAQNEAFIFSNDEILKIYEHEYEKTRDLYFEKMIPFKMILERIHQNIERL